MTDDKDEPRAYKAKLSDFKPDSRNLNQHTQRGREIVKASQRQRGYARPAFAAKDGTVLGGNLSTIDVSADIGLGDGEVFVVETDGKIPIIHKRMDVEASSEEAILLAAEDNRSGEVSLALDKELLLKEIENGIDFGGLFSDNELAEIKDEVQLSAGLAKNLMDGIEMHNDRSLGDKKKQIKPVLYIDEIAIFESALKATGMKNRGQALVNICKEYLESKERQLNF